jgi:hypothetical protein
MLVLALEAGSLPTTGLVLQAVVPMGRSFVGGACSSADYGLLTAASCCLHGPLVWSCLTQAAAWGHPGALQLLALHVATSCQSAVR